MAKKIYYIDDVPYEVAEEKEQDFLEQNQEQEPELRYIQQDDVFVDVNTGTVSKDIFSGNQSSSTEDAPVEQNTPASENSESQYQSEEVQSLSVSPAEKRKIERDKILNDFLEQNELNNEDGSQMTANDVLSLDSIDTKSIDNDITAASNAVNEEKIKINSANSQEQFYDDLYYNDHIAEEDQKESDARFERDQGDLAPSLIHQKDVEHEDKACIIPNCTAEDTQYDPIDIV